MLGLVEQAAKALILTLLGLFVLLLLLGCYSLRCFRGRLRNNSAGILVGVSNAVFEPLYFQLAIFDFNDNRQNFLAAVDKRVHDRWQCRKVGSQGQAGNR